MNKKRLVRRVRTLKASIKQKRRDYNETVYEKEGSNIMKNSQNKIIYVRIKT